MKRDAEATTRIVGKANGHPMRRASDSRGSDGANMLRVRLNGITARESEVAGLVARGLTNKEIASELSVSARTIQTHMERMFKNLGIRSRAELVARVYSALMRKGDEEKGEI